MRAALNRSDEPCVRQLELVLEVRLEQQPQRELAALAELVAFAGALGGRGGGNTRRVGGQRVLLEGQKGPGGQESREEQLGECLGGRKLDLGSWPLGQRQELPHMR